MKTYIVVLYCQYGDWYSTSPFNTREEAERHADRYFRTPERDYYKGITFLEVTLPEFPNEKELGDYPFDEEV